MSLNFICSLGWSDVIRDITIETLSLNSQLYQNDETPINELLLITRLYLPALKSSLTVSLELRSTFAMDLPRTNYALSNLGILQKSFI